MQRIFLFLVLSFSFVGVGTAETKSPCQVEELSDLARLEAAQEKLNTHENVTAVYARGLVCSSCGIGLRMKLKKVEGVDRKRFNSGVDLDVANQLILVAHRPGIVLEIEALSKAVEDAGYDPIHAFLLTSEGVERVEL